jgi:hypothetical protein
MTQSYKLEIPDDAIVPTQVNADGSIGPPPNVKKEYMPNEQEQRSRINDILAMIKDPDASLGEIKRLISAEIAEVLKQMLRYGTPEGSLNATFQVKVLEAQVKSLRELGKELMEADILGRKDFLNLDGQKFAYVAQEWNDGFWEAMRSIDLDESTCNSIMRHFRDLMIKREPEIRRNVDSGSFIEKLDEKSKKKQKKDK